jgi:N6-L-threonylcarbamoyladenine synthase
VGCPSAKALAAARGCRSCRSTTCTATWWRARSATTRRAAVSCAWSRAAATPSSRAWTTRRLRRPGQTLDDAAGEAFDKGARLLGLGYPGGPAVDRLAREGDPRPSTSRASAPGELDFSFSGLKTALLYAIRDLGDAAGERAADLAASYQRAIVDALVSRTRRRSSASGIERLAIGGGVAANSELREAVTRLGVPVWVPAVELCTDNAAMIAGAARFLEPVEYPGYLSLDAAARL